MCDLPTYSYTSLSMSASTTLQGCEMWNQDKAMNHKEVQPDNCEQPVFSIPKGRLKYSEYTSVLRDLADVLPVTPERSTKQMAKKKILLKAIAYIEHLKRHICQAKSAILGYQIDRQECFVMKNESNGSFSVLCDQEHNEVIPGTPPKRRRQLKNVCKKPRKKKHSVKTDQTSTAQKCCRSLYMDTSADADMKLEFAVTSAITSDAVEDCLSAMENDAPLSSSLDSGFESNALPTLTLMEMAESEENFKMAEYYGDSDQKESLDDELNSVWEGRLMCDENSLYDINLESPPQESCKQTQKLTCYASEDDDSDTSPWLPSRSPPLGFRGISQYHSPHGRQDSSCLLLKDLGLSPSLFTCPGQHLSLPQFQDGTECLSSAVLFEDVYLSSQDIDSTSSRYLEDPDQMVPDIFSASSDLLQSAFSLDHCYLSTKCTTTEDCCSISGVKTSVSACSKYPLKEEVDNEKDHVVSSVDDESSGSTWTPSSREKLPTPSSSKKVRRPKHIFQHLKRLQKQHCPFHLKKKCVNGFIMFCRLNRKQYICDHPGTASTAATQALANLWRVMSKQERRPYRTALDDCSSFAYNISACRRSFLNSQWC